MQTLFEDWRGFLIVEGRKENAAQALVKKINDPFLRDFLNSVATDPEHTGSPSLARVDPTPNKKYIEWAKGNQVDMDRVPHELIGDDLSVVDVCRAGTNDINVRRNIIEDQLLEAELLKGLAKVELPN